MRCDILQCCCSSIHYGTTIIRSLLRIFDCSPVTGGIRRPDCHSQSRPPTSCEYQYCILVALQVPTWLQRHAPSSRSLLPVSRRQHLLTQLQLHTRIQQRGPPRHGMPWQNLARLSARALRQTRAIFLSTNAILPNPLIAILRSNNMKTTDLSLFAHAGSWSPH